jgi:acetyltransferase
VEEEKAVHKESDLTTTDFLEHFGRDPEVEAILMYVEDIKEGKHFLEVARAVSRDKPIVMYKAGKFKASSRAAKSHTGAFDSTKSHRFFR